MLLACVGEHNAADIQGPISSPALPPTSDCYIVQDSLFKRGGFYVLSTFQLSGSRLQANKAAERSEAAEDKSLLMQAGLSCVPPLDML